VHPKPHPLAVATGLKVLAKLASVISPAEDVPSSSISALCDKVLACKILGSAFTVARTVLRNLHTASTGETLLSSTGSSNKLATGCGVRSSESSRTPSVKAKGGQSTSADTADNILLSQQWGEVQYLLRDGPEAIAGEMQCVVVLRVAHESLMFLHKLENTASRMGVRRGALSRQLLPFNLETDARDQANVGHELPDGTSDGFLPNEREEMVAQALVLRRLIRVKIADCADVEQAQKSLQLLVDFVTGLQRAAEQQGQDVASVLNGL